MIIVDTNVLLRYLLNDDASLNAKARQIIDNNDIFVTNEVIIEVCYVLNKVYKVEIDVICSLILELISLDNIFFASRAVVYETFKTFMRENLDVVDCMLIAYNKCNGQKVATFDKKLNQALDN